MKKLKVLDLFSGIGGFSLGLERTGGFETVAFCEIDECARKVLNKHWFLPIFHNVSLLTKKVLNTGIRIHNDIHLTDVPYDDIDVICGGFPCQDISVAGKGEGLDGKRSGLWFEYKRLIQEIKPRYVIIENVANLRSKGLSAVLQDLREIGYDAEWHIISARSVGAVHLRERIWIIAYPNSCKLREQSGRRLGENWQDSLQSTKPCEEEPAHPTNTDHLRLWRPFTSEEAKQQWWTEATSGFSAVFDQIAKIEPTVRGGDDGFPKRLDEPRRQRIKQLGNSVVPQIVEIIGRSILDYEEKYAIEQDRRDYKSNNA